MGDKICKIAGCDRQVKAKGWCAVHYNRNRQFGNPEFYPSKQPNKSYRTAALNMLASTGGCVAYDKPMPGSVFDYILQWGEDFDFRPLHKAAPTNVPPGPAKVFVMAERIKQGQPLWVHGDRRYIGDGTE